MTNNKKLPTAIAGSTMFVVLTVLFLTLGGITQYLNIYFGIFFTEVIILGLFTYLICRYKNYNVKETLGLNMPLRGTNWKAFFIALLSYPLIVALNGIYITILSKFMTLPSDIGIPLPSSFLGLLTSILMFAILPGVFEELVFRGFMFRAFGRFKPGARIVLTAILFTIFHYNPINIIGPFLMGLTFGYMRHRSNSLLPGVIGHTTNNSIAMVIGYFANQAESLSLDAAGDPDLAELETMVGDSQVLILVVGLVMLSLLAFGVYRLLKNYPDYSEKVSLVIGPDSKEKRATGLMLVFGFIMLAVAFIVISKKM